MDVLLVEDDDSIAIPLAEGLRREGFEVVRAATGGEALAAEEPDIVLLDLRLPDMDGLEVCRELRARSAVPIIVVSARGEEVDRVVGLELGADDYLVKPFGLRELVARIRAVARRTAAPRDDSEEIDAGRIRIDLRGHRAIVDGKRGAADGQGVRPADGSRAQRGRRRRPRAHPARGLAHDLVRVVEDRRRSCRGASAQARRSRLDRDGARDRAAPRRVSRRLLASYLALTIVVLVALEVPLAIVNAHNEQQDLTAKVERDAFVFASYAEDTLQLQRVPARSPQLAAYARSYESNTGGRVVVVDEQGRSIADSHPITATETSFASRPEIASALRGNTVTGIRRSDTLDTKLLYVAVPVASGGKVFGAVRITYPTSALDRRINRYRLALAAVALIVLAAAALVGLLLARSIARPLRRLEDVAARVGGGELAARASETDGPSDVRSLAGEFNRTTAKLAALLRSQEQFVADASHELRTPLTALRLRLENGETDAALVEAERLAGLVDELLELARADASGGAPGDLLLGDVVERRVELWSALAEERGVRLDAGGDGGVIRAGEGRVEQVLDNLLSNALDASPTGSSITVTAEGGELHVVDEGAGLSAEQRERAFDRFWRASKAPGSGLGLSIARRLVELDGGTIELRSASTGGIDAVVRYPARRG